LSARPALARGDVVLVRFPFTDLSGLKLRPALIVGRVSGDDVVLAFVTSQTAPNQHGPMFCFEPAILSLFLPGFGCRPECVWTGW